MNWKARRNAQAPSGGEGGTPGAGLNSWGSLVAGGSGEDNDSYPKAFVNILVFDKNYNLLEIAYDGINGGHQEGISPDVDHDYMKAVYLAREECYVYLYISNENATLVDVYFDDVVMTHKRSRLIQGSEYYPYGMQTANSWTREDNPENNFLANGGTELNTTTQVYDLYYRNYDPQLGRFGQVDPMSSSHGPISPYHFGLNNPTGFNDPLGDDEYDTYMRMNVVNGPYTAGQPGGYSSVYRGDPYGYHKRFFSESLEMQTRSSEGNMAEDAEKVRSGEMSYEEYGMKYGTNVYNAADDDVQENNNGHGLANVLSKIGGFFARLFGGKRQDLYQLGTKTEFMEYARSYPESKVIVGLATVKAGIVVLPPDENDDLNWDWHAKVREKHNGLKVKVGYQWHKVKGLYLFVPSPSHLQELTKWNTADGIIERAYSRAIKSGVEVLDIFLQYKMWNWPDERHFPNFYPPDNHDKSDWKEFEIILPSKKIKTKN